MKIAATLSKPRQISQNNFQDVKITKVFDETATIKGICIGPRQLSLMPTSIRFLYRW
jgi:hypothetical protein